MTLTAASTRAEVIAAYEDNASYEEDGSVTKAKAFVTACRILLRREPKRYRRGRDGDEVEIDPQIVASELEYARKWASANDTSTTTSGPRVKHFSAADFRS
jgi:hypothetical protein